MKRRRRSLSLNRCPRRRRSKSRWLKLWRKRRRMNRSRCLLQMRESRLVPLSSWTRSTIMYCPFYVERTRKIWMENRVFRRHCLPWKDRSEADRWSILKYYTRRGMSLNSQVEFSLVGTTNIKGHVFYNVIVKDSKGEREISRRYTEYLLWRSKLM